jgi:hypothetical protein
VRRRIEGEDGVVGRLIVTWLLVVALLGVAVVDTVAVLFARFRLADVATVAASAAVSALSRRVGEDQACDEAEEVVDERAPNAHLPRRWCRIDDDGAVTITLRAQASTLVADRIPFTQPFTVVRAEETVRPGGL